MIQVAAVNQSTVVSNKYLCSILPALQVQLNRDFTPAWDISAQIEFYANTAQIPADAYQLVFLDNADQAGALGYHETSNTGMPLGKVFIETAVQYKTAWSVTASHELLEMLVDPYIDGTVFVQTGNTTGRMYAYEVCDAVENFTYNMNGVLVSDFVLPSWFEAYTPYSSSTFSFLNKVSQPFQLAPGGYISYFDVPNTIGWTQAFGQTASRDVSAKSRASRRGMISSERKRSLI